MTGGSDLRETRLLGEGEWLGVEELCRACRMELAVVVELVELGMVTPRGTAPGEWELPATALPRLRTAGRLMRDLGVNVSGAALAVELLETQHRLEQRLRELERLFEMS